MSNPALSLQGIEKAYNRGKPGEVHVLRRAGIEIENSIRSALPKLPRGSDQHLPPIDQTTPQLPAIHPPRRTGVADIVERIQGIATC